MNIWLHRLGVAVVVLALVPFVAHASPALIGHEASYVVLSGSMEPTYSPGDVIYVNDVPAERIEEGDVITFVEGNVGDKSTTHRVVETQRSDGERQFVTKGDNNENIDAEVRTADEIIGVVTFSVPLIGYLILFAQTKLGTVLFFIVPAVLFVLLEGIDLWDAATSNRDHE